jgi:multidrug resistance efflux pump
VITSPIDGIVLNKFRELGDTINYGGNLQAGGGATDIVQLADTTDMRTEVDINEADIAKVAMGQSAAVIPDAYRDKIFRRLRSKDLSGGGPPEGYGQGRGQAPRSRP